MATIYKQLLQYQQMQKAPQLTEQQSKDLGLLICKNWFSKPQSKKTALGRVQSVEPTGTYEVVSYPKYFEPEIDRAIQYFYKSIVKAENRTEIKPMRKRIELKPKPVYRTSDYKKAS